MTPALYITFYALLILALIRPRLLRSRRTTLLGALIVLSGGLVLKPLTAFMACAIFVLIIPWRYKNKLKKFIEKENWAIARRMAAILIELGYPEYKKKLHLLERLSSDIQPAEAPSLSPEDECEAELIRFCALRSADWNNIIDDWDEAPSEYSTLRELYLTALIETGGLKSDTELFNHEVMGKLPSESQSRLQQLLAALSANEAPKNNGALSQYLQAACQRDAPALLQLSRDHADLRSRCLYRLYKMQA